MKAARTLVALCLTAIPVSGAAEPLARVASWHVWNGSALGLNPVVLGDQVKAFRKIPLGAGGSLLTSDAHVRAGAALTASPLFAHPEVFVGLSPLLVLDVELHWGPAANFLHQTFPGYRSSYTPAERGRQPWRTGTYHEGGAAVTLRAAAGPFALIQLLDVLWFRADDYFFHWDIGTIVHAGWLQRGKTLLLWQPEGAWRLFASYDFTRYAERGFFQHSAGAGVYDERLPGGFTGILQGAWYVENPDLAGPRIWMAFLHDWDFPDAR